MKKDLLVTQVESFLLVATFVKFRLTELKVSDNVFEDPFFDHTTSRVEQECITRSELPYQE